MSQINIYHNTNYILFFLLWILTSCSIHSDNCETQLQNKLENDSFAKNRLIVLEQDTKKWKISNLKVDTRVGSRFYYKISIISNTDSLLLNHRKVSLQNISKTLEYEVIELLKRFKNEKLKRTPDVGFQIIYERGENIDSKKTAIIICSLVESVNFIKNKLKEDSHFEQAKIDKIIKTHFFLIKSKE